MYQSVPIDVCLFQVLGTLSRSVAAIIRKINLALFYRYCTDLPVLFCTDPIPSLPLLSSMLARVQV